MRAASERAASGSRESEPPRKVVVPLVQGVAPDAVVVQLPLEKIDLDDQTFMFRATLRSASLARSIRDEGQQTPVVVRMRESDTSERYQLVSGFRRVHAIQALGRTEVEAIIRDNLDDEAAFRASVLENTHRRSYSDIDRAIAISEYARLGHASTDIATMMGLTRQMKNLIQSLLELPQAVQDAVDDPTRPFCATHAYTLRGYAQKHPDLDYARWVGLVVDKRLSVTGLKRALKAHHDGGEGPSFRSVFQAKWTDWDAGEIRFSPVKVTVSELSDDEKRALKAELMRLVDALKV